MSLAQAVRVEISAEAPDLAVQAERMERVAQAALAALDSNARERVFALALLRHAKGAKAAIATWRQELKNR